MVFSLCLHFWGKQLNPAWKEREASCNIQEKYEIKQILKFKRYFANIIASLAQNYYCCYCLLLLLNLLLLLLLFSWCSLRKKCPYLEFFWSIFSCIRTEIDISYLVVFSSNVEKYGPEEFQIQTLFTQWLFLYLNNETLLKYWLF